MSGDRVNRKKTEYYKKKLISGEIHDPEAARDISPNEWERLAKKLESKGIQTIPFADILNNVAARTAPIKKQMNARLEDALVAADLQLAIQSRSSLLQAKLHEGIARNKAQRDTWLLKLQSGDLTAWGEPPAGGGLQARWVEAACEVAERALGKPEGSLAGKSYAELIVWLSKNARYYQKVQECLGTITHDYFWAKERQRLLNEGSLSAAEVQALKELQAEAKVLRELPPEPALELSSPYLLEADDRAALKQMQALGEYRFVGRPGWSQFTQIIELPFGETLRRPIWFDYWLPTKNSIEGNLKDLLRLVEGASRSDYIKIKGQAVWLGEKGTWRWESTLERFYPNMQKAIGVIEDTNCRSRRGTLSFLYS